jgi:hypothetical protein
MATKRFFLKIETNACDTVLMDAAGEKEQMK